MPENKKLYFVYVIIYEPIREYLNIKYENNIPKIKQNDLITKENRKKKWFQLIKYIFVKHYALVFLFLFLMNSKY